MSKPQVQAPAAWEEYVAHRDPEAFEEVLRHYHGLVYAVCRRSLGSGDANVEDAVQETFCKLAENADAIHTNLASWLHSCALNTVRGIIRKEQNRRRRETKWVADNQPQPGRQTDQSVSDLDEAIASLDEKDRTVITEHFLAGRSQTELAEQLGVSPSAVSKRLAKALDKLRRKLALIGVSVTASSLTEAFASSDSQAASLARIADGVTHPAPTGSAPAAATTGLEGAGRLAATKALLAGHPGVTACVLAAAASVAGYLAHPPVLRALLPAPAVTPGGQLAVGAGQAGDSLGQAMAADSGRLLVGAPSDNSAGDAAGAVHTFRREGESWTPTGKITAPAGADSLFGGEIALDGDTAAIGGTAAFTGRVVSKRKPTLVQIYRFTEGRWTHQQTLQSDDRGDPLYYFGAALAIRGDRLLVWRARGQSRSVIAYQRSGETWTPTEEIASPTRQPTDVFGWDIALNDDWAAIAAPGDGEADQRLGAVYLYRLSGGRWNPEQKLTPPDGRKDWRFGEALALDGNTLAIGASNRNARPKGAGRIYLYENRGSRWRLKQTLEPSDESTGARFGGALAMRNGVLVAGAPFSSSPAGAQAGAAHVYLLRWGKWVSSEVLRSTASEAHSSFGSSAAIEEGAIVVGCAGTHRVSLKRGIQDWRTAQTQSPPSVRTKPGRAFTFAVE